MTKKETEKVAENKAPKKEVEATEETTDSVKESYSLEELKKMKYNEFKKLASSLGVKCTGTREEITEKILAVPVDVPMNEPVEDEPEVEEKSNVVPMKKKKSIK